MLHGVHRAQEYVCTTLQVAVTKSKASRQSKMPKLSGNGSVSSSADGCGGVSTSNSSWLTYLMWFSRHSNKRLGASTLKSNFSELNVLYTEYALYRKYDIQGADNELGQFLIQDIYATANHRNCLRHSLESCQSLVWWNVNRPSLAKKYASRTPNSLKVCYKLCAPHS